MSAALRRSLLAMLAAGAALALTAATPRRPPAAAGAIPDSTVGLARASVFATPAPPAPRPNTADPAEGQRLPRAYRGAPPRIPHGIADFVPITRERNACVECHDPATASESGAVPLPASHYRDLRRAPRVQGKDVVGARYVCVSCHVPVTDAPPLVENRFRSAP